MQTIPVPLQWLLATLFHGDPHHPGTLECVIVDDSELAAQLRIALAPDTRFMFEDMDINIMTVSHQRLMRVRLWVRAKWQATEDAKQRHNLRRDTRLELKTDIYNKIKNATKCADNQCHQLTEYLMMSGNESVAKAYGIENFKERWVEAEKFGKYGKVGPG